MNLCDLPDSMLESVFELLPNRDQARARQTCRRLREIPIRHVCDMSWKLGVLEPDEREAAMVATLRSARGALSLTTHHAWTLRAVARRHPELVAGLSSVRLPILRREECDVVFALLALPSLRALWLSTMWEDGGAVLRDPRVSVHTLSLIVCSNSGLDAEQWANVGGRHIEFLEVDLRCMLAASTFESVVGVVERARDAGLRATRVEFICFNASHTSKISKNRTPCALFLTTTFNVFYSSSYAQLNAVDNEKGVFFWR